MFTEESLKKGFFVYNNLRLKFNHIDSIIPILALVGGNYRYTILYAIDGVTGRLEISFRDPEPTYTHYSISRNNSGKLLNYCPIIEKEETGQ